MIAAFSHSSGIRLSHEAGEGLSLERIDMNKLERVRAALAGKPVDRVPISFWRHFPDIDEDPLALADQLLRFHEKFDLDFLKVMPSGVYCVEDWGCRVQYDGASNGAKVCLEHAIRTPKDWRKIKPLAPEQGAMGRELKCLRAVKAGREDNAPILQTLFSPLTVASKLSGPELLLRTLREEPDALLAALEVITETMISYARASFEAGAEGFFYATQMASRDRLSLAEHRKFAAPYDLRILKEISAYSSFNLLHIHGENIFFEEFSGYPVQAINWHDRMTRPTLGQGQKIFSGAVVGGLEEWGILMSGPESSIHAQVQEAISQTAGRRLIIAPGCGLPIDVPEPFLRAARWAVEGK